MIINSQKEQFFGSLSKPAKDTVEVENTEPEAFRMFLQFIYGGEVEISQTKFCDMKTIRKLFHLMTLGDK